MAHASVVNATRGFSRRDNGALTGASLSFCVNKARRENQMIGKRTPRLVVVRARPTAHLRQERPAHHPDRLSSRKDAPPPHGSVSQSAPAECRAALVNMQLARRVTPIKGAKRFPGVQYTSGRSVN
ncbi:hypothetical protein E2C01_083473 [Portunus trituberculatus]|uniref:Uncharacterized protein n=1 Tax=Portunus trituberculatus TaxID=210409 RepID=A0A5B7J841_PORTR|nr:hypothetical protein [Portunus trituberculatus]